MSRRRVPQLIGFEIAEIPAGRTHDLRRRVLRDGTRSRAVELDGDHDPGTFHLGAIDDDGQVVAISTWSCQPMADENDRAAVRLRGMASDPAVRGSGAGGAVLDAGIERCRREGIEVVWANARIPALEFYRRRGFVTVGDEFVDAGTALPHIAIRLEL